MVNARARDRPVRLQSPPMLLNSHLFGCTANLPTHSENRAQNDQGDANSTAFGARRWGGRRQSPHATAGTSTVITGVGSAVATYSLRTGGTVRASFNPPDECSVSTDRTHKRPPANASTVGRRTDESAGGRGPGVRSVLRRCDPFASSTELRSEADASGSHDDSPVQNRDASVHRAPPGDRTRHRPHDCARANRILARIVQCATTACLQMQASRACTVEITLLQPCWHGSLIPTGAQTVQHQGAVRPRFVESTVRRHDAPCHRRAREPS